MISSSKLTNTQWLAIAMLAIANLCSTVVFSCLGPFYPDEAKRKGMSKPQIGLVFGFFELVMFVAAPLIGKYMHLIGSKWVCSGGLLINALAAIVFGTLKWINNGVTFFWASLLIRLVEAFGEACFHTASFTICAKCFPSRISTIVGIMETFAGLGFTVGPVIGGVLYEYGGFETPFFVLGSVLMMASFLSFFLFQEIEDDASDHSTGMLGMLRIPALWLMVFAVVICAISLSFLDPILAGQLAPFKLSAIKVGLMFLLCDGFYCLTATLWGFILDRWKCCSNLLMFLGSSATIAAMLVFGLFGKNLVVIGISLSVIGIASGALYIPSFQRCLDVVRRNGYDDSFHTNGCVSGLYQSSYALGGFIGPTLLGGLGVQTFGFCGSTIIIAVINVIFIFSLLAYVIMKHFFVGDTYFVDAESAASIIKEQLQHAQAVQHICSHSEAYVRYIESMYSDVGGNKTQRTVSKWGKNLQATQRNTTSSTSVHFGGISSNSANRRQLAQDWIRLSSNGSKHREEELMRALWKLRDQLIEGTTGLRRNTDLS
uniref:Major facilitator superfamily (MFS) profile domain-containing protein n=1 Tax=Globodera rostochiensis TaxID=31243 RepID=A0A914GSB4_GLORO